MAEILATYEYKSIQSGTAYSITCTNPDTCTKAVIPSEYNGLPVTTIGEYAFYGNSLTSRLKSVTIPNSITTLSSNAFFNCDSLTSIEIPNSVTSIGDYAFDCCSSLIGIEIPSSVTEIGKLAFSACDSLRYICCNVGSQPDGWDSEWKDGAYASVIWGKSIDAQGLLYTLINNDTEYEVSGIQYVVGRLYTKIIIPSTHKGLPVTIIGDEALRQKSPLGSIEIPDSVISIGNYAFYCCNTLTSVVIGNGVTSIGSNAFCGCPSLKEITMGKSVTSIGEYAFCECDSLKEITIPSNVTSIGNNAFFSCDSLNTVVILAKNPMPISIGLLNGVFSYNNRITFYCPAALGEAYKTASGWSEYADQIVADDFKLSFLLNAKAEKKYFASKNELKNELSALKELVLDMAHPVGSVYFSMEATDPSVLFGGEWEELDSERTLWLTSTSKSVLNGLGKPQTIAAALPNIKGEELKATIGTDGTLENLVEMAHSVFGVDIEGETGTGAFYSNIKQQIAIGANVANPIISLILGDWLSALGSIDVVDAIRTAMDASRYNSIYSDDCDTVQPPAIRMYGWRRIA